MAALEILADFRKEARAPPGFSICFFPFGCKQDSARAGAEFTQPGACLLARPGIAYAGERSFHASLALSIRPTERASEEGQICRSLFLSLFCPLFSVAEPQIVIRLGSPSLPPSLPPSFGPSYSRTTGSSMGGECMDGPRRGPQVL